jgi:hypothetical protein
MSSLLDLIDSFFQGIKRFFARLFGFQKSLGSRASTSNSWSANSTASVLARSICVVGERSSGKTTYLAALIRARGLEPENGRVQRIFPVGSDSEKLEDQAINILEQGLTLEVTKLLGQPSGQMPSYGFRIEMYDRRDKPLELNIFSKDYSGELFQEIRTLPSAQLDDYMADCAASEGILLLIDGNDYLKDGEYEVNLREFLKLLGDAMTNDDPRRIAVVLSKCEERKLYAKREELRQKGVGDQEFIQRLFPKMYNILNTRCPNNIEIEYFTLSSFGVLKGNARSPNSKVVSDPTDPSLSYATLRNKNAWQPFGLFAPLYWLCTGDRHPDLD